MFKQPPPAPTASAVGPCPTLTHISRTPGTGSLFSTIAPPPPPPPNTHIKKARKATVICLSIGTLKSD